MFRPFQLLNSNNNPTITEHTQRVFQIFSRVSGIICDVFVLMLERVCLHSKQMLTPFTFIKINSKTIQVDDDGMHIEVD